MLDKKTVKQIADAYVAEVKKVYDPTKVVLFGSYVNGNPHKYSDIDIAVIFNDFKGDWFDTVVELGTLTWKVSLDIEPHLMDEQDDPSGFLAHVLKTGEIIYQAA